MTSFGTLVAAMVGTYLLYLRVSGQFHIIIGLMHMFGYDLPETHRRYLLASSLTDFWRRINIYWKDFMVKVVYFPVYFPVPEELAILRAKVVATVVRVRGHLGTALLPVVLASRRTLAFVDGHSVLGHPGRARGRESPDGATRKEQAACAGPSAAGVEHALKVAGNAGLHDRVVVVLAITNNRRVDHHDDVVDNTLIRFLPCRY